VSMIQHVVTKQTKHNARVYPQISTKAMAYEQKRERVLMIFYAERHITTGTRRWI
jgi:hypothetical protein